eukprot:TRINITY_DN5204_c0_g1_i3.p1 TRINITY_DN5204_c0_g1~~TRINITY_DN5204_c0_g1_i3.p1  ORF type:complete len:360 (+),score=62.89 TRINITY_DN5204_c0_g1_i3:317-1396(+)
MKQMEANTFYWFLPVMGYRMYLSEAREKIAEYVGVDLRDIVIIDNASSGINAVLRSLMRILSPGAKILRLSIAYPMVQHTVSYIATEGNFQVVDVFVDFPTDAETILSEVEAEFERQGPGSISVAVFSHISSMPAIILPIKELILLAHSYGAKVVVDGAHAVGQVPLNLTDLTPDFYTSNAHKWLCSPKSAAFLYVKREYHNLIHPTVISNQYGDGWDMIHEFEYVGTRDYSPYLTLIEALEWRKNITDDAIFTYNNNLCLTAGHFMAKAWNTTLPIPDSMTASLVNVQIPCNSLSDPTKCYTWLEPEIYLWLFSKNIWALVFPDTHGKYYVRLSCQIYNELDDYVRVMKAIDEFNIPQ